MKKILYFILTCALLVGSVTALASCGEAKLDGKYIDGFGDIAIEFDGDKFTVYETANNDISVSGTYKLAYDDDGEVDKIKFTLDDANDKDRDRFAFLKKTICEFDYDRENGKTFIEIDDVDFKKQ